MDNIINDWGKLAGSVSAILGLLALVLFNPIKAHITEKRAEKRRAEEAKHALEEAERNAAAAFRVEMREAIKGINKTLSDFRDDIGDLQYERLSQAHDFYTTQGWCPTSKKQQLCEMHRSYRKKNRNHLSEHYEDDILRLAEKPPMTNAHTFAHLQP